MNPSNNITPSKLLTGEGEALRQHSLTRWMSRDLMQAAVDFCRNLGFTPAYAECSPDHLTRYLFWRLPQGASVEVRTGRNRAQFEQLDDANRQRSCALLSLHVNEGDVYSAVWISQAHFEEGKAFLTAHGITCPERKEG